LINQVIDQRLITAMVTRPPSMHPHHPC